MSWNPEDLKAFEDLYGGKSAPTHVISAFMHGAEYGRMRKADPLEPQRWECEVVFKAREVDQTVGSQFAWAIDAHDPAAGSECEQARAKLGFDSTGRVWFADATAYDLAEALRYVATTLSLSDYHRNDLNRAADRLAGPKEE